MKGLEWRGKFPKLKPRMENNMELEKISDSEFGGKHVSVFSLYKIP